MNTTQQKTGAGIIILSFVLAFFLTVLPLPVWVNWLRPQWVMLVLICLSLLIPERIGLSVAFLSGLLLDLLVNTPLGEHALLMTMVVYFTIKFHSRINFFPFWQKLMIIFSLVLGAQVLQFWLESLMDRPIHSLLYWSSILTTTLLWPWVMSLLRHRYQRLTDF